MQKPLAALVLTMFAQGALAVPETLSLTADFPTGAGPGTPAPYHFSTSFSIDSDTATTDVVTSGATTLYGYSKLSLMGFGFNIGNVSYVREDIDPRVPAVGHISDFYLDAPVGSGSVTAVWFYLDPLSVLDVQLGGAYTADPDAAFIFFDRRMFVGLFTTAPLTVVSSVPELDTWALMLAGVGLLLPRTRKRRRS